MDADLVMKNAHQVYTIYSRAVLSQCPMMSSCQRSSHLVIHKMHLSQVVINIFSNLSIIMKQSSVYIEIGNTFYCIQPDKRKDPWLT